jgi:drug/metabolite transporter (DMT)-like permease
MTRHGTGQGLALALASAATFGTSGTFATSLFNAGWSTGAVVTARMSIAALVLFVPGVLALRRALPALRGPRAGQSLAVVLVYGTFAVATAQFCYFQAVERLSVGVALLLEYLGIILVVLWMWLMHGQRPRRLTVVGSLVAMGGLALVLDLTGDQHVNLGGVLWGLGAAVGLAVFFVISAREGDLVPPLVLAWGGLSVGALTFLLLAAVRLLPMHVHFVQVAFSHHHVSWLVPILGIALISAAFAYVAGISAARLLGARLASFVGLAEVLFAVFFAWLLLDQLPSGLQLVGGAFIIAGVTLVKIDEASVRAAGPLWDASDTRDEVFAAG